MVGHDQEHEVTATTLSKFRAGNLESLAVVCVGWSDAVDAVSDVGVSVSAIIDVAHEKNIPVAFILAPLPSLPPAKAQVPPSYERKLVDRVGALNGSVQAIGTAKGAVVIDGPAILAPDYGPSFRTPISDLAISRLAHAVADRIEVAPPR